MTDHTSSDVLIIGGGIMGAAVARLLREADPMLSMTMIDSGAVIGGTAGVHLHDVEDPEVWGRYNERVASGIQGMYTGAEVVESASADVRGLTPGMFRASTFGENADEMPATAFGWNAGGMGVHWTAATPWPADHETFADGSGSVGRDGDGSGRDGDDDRAGGDAPAWQADLDTARRLLDVTPSAIGPTPMGNLVLDVFARRFAGTGPGERMPQPMPMAIQPSSTGPSPRTGPAHIFAPISDASDAAFTLRTGEIATALIIDGGQVTGARTRTISDGVEHEVRARIVMVCADAMRTPQLLFASGIRPPALGRYLNEHAFITARVLVDLDHFGVEVASLPVPREGEFCTDSLWIPQNGAGQPFHGQIMNTTYTDEFGHPLAHSVGLSLYTPVESRAENRISFSETETDLAGMPRMSFEFEYSAADRVLIGRALDLVQSLALEFGEFDPNTERALLPPGSSLHLTGTVRSGADDDGTSVCSPDGRVWGFENLFVAGNGVIPTSVVANATLTGVITAVRAARAAHAMLSPSRI
ncbi:GMC oxidoreductase [Subtercola lobariae]|uniref:Pyranose oxidase n=1 Tax=Subtercola lobariae TaxID=1588641 RepID=A0A917B726_9MICO|nr:GMC oxidoreductase [Subtercola lobariae]GGF29036.1 pyranose oxidase [Subtercola lobariae]